MDYGDEQCGAYVYHETGCVGRSVNLYEMHFCSVQHSEIIGFAPADMVEREKMWSLDMKSVYIGDYI